MPRFDANESDFLTYEDQAMRWLIPELPPTPRAGGGASGAKRVDLIHNKLVIWIIEANSQI